jgi:thiamine biosynthesis lipoprotein
MTLCSALVPICLGLATPAIAQNPVAVTAGRRIMGAPWKIKVFAADHATAEAAVEAALAEVERLDRVLSDYDSESELFRLSASAPATEPVPVSDDLWNVLVAAETFREKSEGAFDITVGPLTTLWRQARRTGKLPREDKLATARAAVGGGIEFDHATRRVRLTKPGMRLDAGGIGMGYAADRAMDLLKDRGITSAMIDASGDILVSDAPPGTEGWRILVAPLEPGGDGETITLVNAAVTTSGDAFQAVEIDGVRYSHIVDPRTGFGVKGLSAVTVIAPDATTADALATAASVLGMCERAKLVTDTPGASARFVWGDGGKIRTLSTHGWPGPSSTRGDPAP